MSVSFVRDLSRRFRQSGCVAAKAHDGGRVGGADAAACQRIKALVAAHNDHSIDEHRQSLAEAGRPLSRSALGRTLLKLGLTRKKRRSATTLPALPPPWWQRAARTFPDPPGFW